MLTLYVDTRMMQARTSGEWKPVIQIDRYRPVIWLRIREHYVLGYPFTACRNIDDGLFAFTVSDPISLDLYPHPTVLQNQWADLMRTGYNPQEGSASAPIRVPLQRSPDSGRIRARARASN